MEIFLGILEDIVSNLYLQLIGLTCLVYIFLIQAIKFFSRVKKTALPKAELEEEFRKTLLQARLEIQEETLNHVGNEIHANFSNLVSFINIQLSEMLLKAPPELKENVKDTKNLVKRLLKEMKALSHTLNTDYIKVVGFASLLQNDLERMSKHYKIECNIDGKPSAIDSQRGILLFRLCQEVLNNIMQHSQATEINVYLKYTSETLNLRIVDNGKGFEINKVKNDINRGSGLLNIKKRAELIQANLLIDSKPGRGTEVNLTVPIVAKISYAGT